MPDPTPRVPGSLLRPLGGLAGTLAILAWIASGPRTSPEKPAPPPPAKVADPEKHVPAAVSAPPAPVAPARIEPDRAAIARAEGTLDGATRARAEAEARLADARLALEKATVASARAASEGRSLGSRVKDPTARIERATNRAALAGWEIRKIRQELTTLEEAPRPKSRALTEQTAVSRPIDGKEYHFEVRDDRVAFIDIDRLTEMVKLDARIKVRMNARARRVTGIVGPAGEFSMRYEVAAELPETVSELVEAREITYQLRGWELVPEQEARGESYESSRGPASTFARTIGRLNPSRATITLWVYPGGFPLYRRLRDDLHGRGFLVAARPLPAGMAIRGSPAGSVSAGQ